MGRLGKWVAAGVLVLFLLGMHQLEQGHRAADLENLKNALRRTAAACYAVEGAYPPDVDYMRRHYGLQYDESRFFVDYELTASNLMPQITVLER